jgi:hypothetical protein
MAVPCANRQFGCPCDSFDGRPTTFCCASCKEGGPCRLRTHEFTTPRYTSSRSAVVCATPGCPCDSFDGRAATACTASCKEAGPCRHRTHVFLPPSVPVAQASVPPPSVSLPVPAHAAATRPTLRQPSAAVPPPPVPYPSVAARSGGARIAQCANLRCPCDSFNGQYGEYCCRTCRQGAACANRIHVLTTGGVTAPPIPPPPAAASFANAAAAPRSSGRSALVAGARPPPPPPTAIPALCANPACSCDSFNGQPGEYCCRSCRMNPTGCAQRYHPYSPSQAPQPLAAGAALGATSRLLNAPGRSSSQQPSIRSAPIVPGASVTRSATPSYTTRTSVGVPPKPIASAPTWKCTCGTSNPTSQWHCKMCRHRQTA